jgi:hypothetical protein
MSYTKLVALSIAPALMVLAAGDFGFLTVIPGLIIEALILARFFDSRRKSPKI